MKKKFDSNIKVSTKVVVGFPAEAICDVAEKEGVELIVISSAGERGFSKRIIGSVAGKVCSISNINVLLISNEEKELIKHSTTKKSDNKNKINRDYTRFRNDLYVLLRFISVEKRLNSDYPEEIIDSIERRIKYLDLIYKTLNTHSESEYVNVKEYFKKYSANFYSLYKNKQPGIEFVNKSEDNFNIPDNIITPLTAIINELIVNSLKFAYEDYDVEKKIITEKVTKNKDICEVFYKDNGKGLPDDFDKDNPRSTAAFIIADFLTGSFAEFAVALTISITASPLDTPLLPSSRMKSIPLPLIILPLTSRGAAADKIASNALVLIATTESTELPVRYSTISFARFIPLELSTSQNASWSNKADPAPWLWASAGSWAVGCVIPPG